MGFSVKVDIPNPKRSINNLTGNNRVGIFVAETCARYFNPYVPMQTGTLSQTYTTEPNKVIYHAPYAKAMYYGKGFNFNKEKHPQATSYWNRAAMAAHKKSISNEITMYIKKGHA